eukprot:9485573-Pyramimonas_sp.AAC.1
MFTATRADLIEYIRQPTNESVSIAMPTDSKGRQTQKKAKEKATGSTSSTTSSTKRPRQFEKHYDDCGQDWSGLGKDVMMTMGFSSDGEASEDHKSDEDVIQDMHQVYFEPYWFAGLKEVPHCETRETPMANIFNTMVAMDIFQSKMTDVEFDVCEIAGGQARTSIILAKCR